MPFISESGGRIHAHKLEYNLVDHCNLACRECSHLSPFLRPHVLPLDNFTLDINALAQVYRVQRLRFVGGEPLLNREICAYVKAARASGMTRDIEVVSNGTLLASVSDDLLALINSLALSLYPDCGPADDVLERTRQRCLSFNVKLRIEHIKRFRKTQTSAPIEDQQLLDGVFKSCLIAHTWACQAIYDGRFYLCSRPIYSDTYLAGFGQAPLGFKTLDGIALHEPHLLERLRAYLGSKTPLNACRYCLGTVGRYQPHGQLPSTLRWKPAPDAQPVALKVDGARMRYLIRWQRVELAVLRRLPSRRLSRMFALAQTALIGD